MEGGWIQSIITGVEQLVTREHIIDADGCGDGVAVGRGQVCIALRKTIEREPGTKCKSVNKEYSVRAYLVGGVFGYVGFVNISKRVFAQCQPHNFLTL